MPPEISQPDESSRLPAPNSAGAPGGQIVRLSTLQRQLSDLPSDELSNLAEELGLDPTRYKTPQELVAAVHDRRQMIANMDRQAMLDVIRWGRRPLTVNASNEQIAREIVCVKSMRFEGLSHRGLVILAKIRGIEADDDADVPELIQALKKQEGLFHKLNRKRRAMLGSIVAKMFSDPASESDYKFIPPESGDAPPSNPPGPQPSGSIKREIEDSGLFGGITNRIKKTADQYLNQKLDEVEARIDQKLDEIDRRLAEWRDKEIANRIRILKITLWASVIVGIFSLIYSYVTTYIWPH
ncbi:MAG: hypothetical protein ABSF29_08685 [Tepidisphaeraceae bacterium]|jgi:hypothetical protein